jgi:hypothetical protein
MQHALEEYILLIKKVRQERKKYPDGKLPIDEECLVIEMLDVLWGRMTIEEQRKAEGRVKEISRVQSEQ